MAGPCQRRSVDLGLLFDRDPWLADALIKSFPDVTAQLNEPYSPRDGVMHLLNLHAAPRGLHHLMIEICNDLINNERNKDLWEYYSHLIYLRKMNPALYSDHFEAIANFANPPFPLARLPS